MPIKKDNIRMRCINIVITLTEKVYCLGTISSNVIGAIKSGFLKHLLCKTHIPGFSSIKRIFPTYVGSVTIISKIQ